MRNLEIVIDLEQSKRTVPFLISGTVQSIYVQYDEIAPVTIIIEQQNDDAIFEAKWGSPESNENYHYEAIEGLENVWLVLKPNRVWRVAVTGAESGLVHMLLEIAE